MKAMCADCKTIIDLKKDLYEEYPSCCVGSLFDRVKQLEESEVDFMKIADLLLKRIEKLENKG